MALIFALSSQSSFPQPPSAATEVAAVVAHLFLYGVLAVLLLVAVLDDVRVSLRHGLIVIAICTLYGVSDEIHQSFVPGRNPSVFDVVVNSVGATIACLAVWRVLDHRQNVDDRPAT